MRLAALATDPRDVGERILEPGRRQVVLSHLRDRLEHLEVVPRALDPERDHGLERRAARHRAGDLRHPDDRGFRPGEARARPRPHLLGGGGLSGRLAAKPDACGLVQGASLTIYLYGVIL